MQTNLISLNELTLPRFLWSLAFGRGKTYLLRVRTYHPKLQGLFDKLAKRALARGRIEDAITLVPELKRFQEFEKRLYLKEVFKNYEPWQNRYYGLDAIDVDKAPFGYAVKQVTSNHVFWKSLEIFTIDAVSRRLTDGDYKIHGIMRDTLDLCRFYFGADAVAHCTETRMPRRAVNLITAGTGLLFTLAAIVGKMRPSVTKTPFPVAVDHLRDSREAGLLREIRDAGPLLLLDRAKHNNYLDLPEDVRTRIVANWDGRLTFGQGLAAIAEVTGDIWRLYVHYGNRPVSLFADLTTIPFKKITIRAILNRYPVKYFIGRDEYNVDHVLRRDEMHRIGGKSIGLSNGLYPCFSSLTPNIRYINYDVYYSYAAPLYERYKTTWPEDMEVKSIGTYSVPRDWFDKPPGPRGEVILIATRIAWDRPELVEMVRALAAAYPERPVLWQFKKPFVSEEAIADLLARCSKDRPNVALTTDNIYDLLAKTWVLVSDISTLVMESIHSGLPTFVADILEQDFNVYREFPGLCVETADELVRRVKAWEDGSAPYPHRDYLERFGLADGMIGFDKVRMDIGLPPRQSPSI